VIADLELISLDLIRLDEGVWPRSGFDHSRIADFAALYETGGLEALPPVVIVPDGAGQYLVCDGHHRLAALYALGVESAPTHTEGLPGGLTPEQFAFEYAVASASMTAKPLTRAERNLAVDRLLAERPELSDRRIADVCGCRTKRSAGGDWRGPTDHPCPSRAHGRARFVGRRSVRRPNDW
jgi:ParB-like nuclease family protein